MTVPTPSQTVGPFFHLATAWLGPDIVDPGSPNAITLCGRVLDGAGAPVGDALVELWEADHAGGFPATWGGFGRALTDAAGGYRFTIVKPGRVDNRQAPHMDVSVFSRGLLQRVVTRIYFQDEAVTNAADPVLDAIDPGRRDTLIAQPDGDALRFDIHLQGERETVFFAW